MLSAAAAAPSAWSTAPATPPSRRAWKLWPETPHPDFAGRAAHGAAVVYQTMNPPYHQWSAQFPKLQSGVLAAAETARARLVSMENVYM